MNSSVLNIQMLTTKGNIFKNEEILFSIFSEFSGNSLLEKSFFSKPLALIINEIQFVFSFVEISNEIATVQALKEINMGIILLADYEEIVIIEPQLQYFFEAKLPVLLYFVPPMQNIQYRKVLLQWHKSTALPLFPIHTIHYNGSIAPEQEMLFNGNELMCEASGVKNIAIELLAGIDADIMEKYTEGEHLDNELIKQKMIQYTRTGKLIPVFIHSYNSMGNMEQLITIVTAIFGNN